jgi:hypothetical protein
MVALKIMKRRGFLVKLALTFALVALADLMFWQAKLGIGNFGFYGLGLLVALILVRPMTVSSVAGKLTVAATILYASAIFYDVSFLSIGLFWIAISVAALMPFSSYLRDGWQWFWRLFIHGFAALLKPFNDATKIRKVKDRRPPGNRFSVRATIGLFALPVVGGSTFFALFVQANPILEKLVADWHLPSLDIALIFRAILWIIVGTMIWSLFRPWRQRGGPKSRGNVSADVFPVPSLASITLALFVFNALFFMQNTMDVAFLSGLMPLPDHITLAQYAHRGAYPLIGTALLAGLFVLVVLKPDGVSSNNKLVRTLVVAWIVQNVVLVGSSILRTWNYVEVYSLTQMRIAALVWMSLVGIGLGLICWRLLSGKSGSWLINANLWASGLVLTAFCFVDTGAMSAQWNITHAEEVGGQGVELDLCHMRDLGAGAIGPLMNLEKSNLPLAFRQRVKATRLSIQFQEQTWLSTSGWTWRRGQRLAVARKTQATLPELDIGESWRDCNGYPGAPVGPPVDLLQQDPRGQLELTPPVTP